MNPCGARKLRLSFAVFCTQNSTSESRGSLFALLPRYLISYSHNRRSSLDRMAANFWGISGGVFRNERSHLDDDRHCFPSGNSCDFSSGNWLWGNEVYEPAPCFLFDFNDNHGVFGKHAHSEPVSPSSVDTTPTTSELPIATGSENGRSKHQEEEDIDMSSVASIAVSKKSRKTYSSPVHESSLDRNGRKKKYDAPPGVWRNSGGFISTVYINKKRVYGPLRRDVNDAVRDREEMLLAKSVILTEEGMRAFVQGMKERYGPERQAVSLSDITATNSPDLLAPLPFQRETSSSSSNATVVRHSSRPVRAAAKRNVFTAFAYDGEVDLHHSEQNDFGDDPSANQMAFY